jgi:hypothetical protein
MSTVPLPIPSHLSGISIIYQDQNSCSDHQELHNESSAISVLYWALYEEQRPQYIFCNIQTYCSKELWPSARLAERGRRHEKTSAFQKHENNFGCYKRMFLVQEQPIPSACRRTSMTAEISRMKNPCHACNKGSIPDKADNARSYPVFR